MAKRVKDWTTQDVMVWLTKNMGRLNSAESLRVYVQMESITGQMMLGFNKNDSTRFGLIKANDFEKILKKLQSHDEKIAQNERKTIGKKKKKGFWQSDNKDSGLDESNSVCDDVQGPGFRDIHVNSDSPGSANTSGTGSFMSMSGGSTHKHHTPLVQSVNYESTPAPGRQTIPEATYVAPEEIHRTGSGTFERVSSHDPQDCVNPQIPAKSRPPLPPPPLPSSHSHVVDSLSYVNLPRRGSHQILPSQLPQPFEGLNRGLSETPPPKKGYIHLDRCASQPAIPLKQKPPRTNSPSTGKPGSDKQEDLGYVNLPGTPTKPPESDSVQWVRPVSFAADQDHATSSCARRRSYENLDKIGNGGVVPADSSPFTDTYVDPISILRHSAIPRSNSLGNVSPGLWKCQTAMICSTRNSNFTSPPRQ